MEEFITVWQQMIWVTRHHLLLFSVVNCSCHKCRKLIFSNIIIYFIYIKIFLFGFSLFLFCWFNSCLFRRISTLGGSSWRNYWDHPSTWVCVVGTINTTSYHGSWFRSFIGDLSYSIMIWWRRTKETNSTEQEIEVKYVIL